MNAQKREVPCCRRRTISEMWSTVSILLNNCRADRPQTEVWYDSERQLPGWPHSNAKVCQGRRRRSERSPRLKYLRYLLVFVPLAIIANLLKWNPLFTFGFSCIALIPLAGLLGEATEELSIHTGPKIGGLLNATLGNAAELIITIVALSAGKLDLVKASITGSILGNLLLILGASLLIGGLKNGPQRFDRGISGMSATLMTL